MSGCDSTFTESFDQEGLQLHELESQVEDVAWAGTHDGLDTALPGLLRWSMVEPHVV